MRAPLVVGRVGAVLLLAGAGGPTRLAAQVDQRFDLRVPMRDGVELSANVWMPAGTGRYPVVLVRTPYIKTTASYAALGAKYASHGYAFVVQDTRGRGDSEGRFDFFFTDAADGYDTIEWVAKQPWSNGRVGTVGGSYLATVQWLAARERPTGLTCMIPQAPAGTYFNELPRIGGAWLMAWSLNWINGTSGRTAQGGVLGETDWERVYRHRPLITMDDAMGRDMPIYNDLLTHSTLDEYWKRIHFEDRDFEKIDLPIFAFSGWFDADQKGTMRYWAGIRDHSPAANRQHIIVGPWNHGGAIRGGSQEFGEMRFSPESVVDVTALHLEFFDYCLKKSRPSFAFPRARVYLMGSNQWRDYDAYPPKEMTPRSFFLTSGGSANTLGGDGRLAQEPSAESRPDRFSYDPARPVPAGVGGVAQAVDHRAIERRDDVLVYSSEPLTEPIDIVGPVSVVVHAASDARDTDFTAKLLDVYPDGRAIKLGWWDAAVIRARYRKGYEKEELLTPGQVEEYQIDLGHIGHTFLPGHRLRVEVSSSAYPFIAPNPNTGNPIATDTASRVARQTVYHDRSRPSRLVLPVVPRKVIP